MKRERGFSLVELMIVVAIMAILAAIAIPSFLRFSQKAKTAEATTNLAAIRTCEESYRSEEDTYWTCGPNPVAWALGSSMPKAWEVVAGWDDIGFQPDGLVRYQYEVAGGTALVPSSVYTVTAMGDIDEADLACTFTVSNDPAEAASAQYPKPLKSGGDF